MLYNQSLSPGDLVTLIGHTVLDGGERAIEPQTLSVTLGSLSNVPGALFARSNWLGGGPLSLAPTAIVPF